MPDCSPRRFFLVLALVLPPVTCWASPTPKEVADQMSAGNVRQAESLTREILRERPDSAKAHYYLGQILTTEGDYKDAYAELTKAAQLDKSLSFASSEAKFRGEMRKVEVNLGKVAAPQATNETHAGRTFLIVLAVLAMLGGIAWMVSARNAREEKKSREAARQQELAGQTARIVALLEKSSSLEVAAKLSDDPSKKLAALSGVRAELNELLTRNRKQRELVPESTVNRIERSLRQIETGEVAPEPRTFRQDRPESRPRPQASVTPQPAPSQPQVTNNYVSGNSNDGLVEGLVLGKLMSGGRETRVERERDDERDRDDRLRRSSLDFGLSSFDSGSDSGFDSSSDSGFDSGSDSSFDSGSGGGSDW